MEIMTIKVINIIEHEDGSATYELDMSEEAQRLLIEKGFITLLEEMIDNSTAENIK